MLTLQQNIDLSSFNTLRLNSIATNYVVLNDLNQLTNLKKLTDAAESYFILGGGSNVILPNQYNGLVIHNQLKGISVVEHNTCMQITAMAGEVWDDFVVKSLESGGFGLENLSIIPGTVGASPVQNIGAYGVEVKDYIEYVTVFDLLDGKILQLTNDECRFSYRNSILKKMHNYLVLSVTFMLPKTAKLNCNYGDIQSKLNNIENPTAWDLREIIIQTRQSKLPDPAVIGNVGSFFHNPIIEATKASQLLAKYPKLPVYKTDIKDKLKISAGWLIDNLGMKGFTQGNFAVYDKQALVIVHNGGGEKSELLEFANLIQAKVLEEYDVRLNIEPIIL